MDKNLGTTSQKSDLFAVILSFSAGIIQLLLFVLGTISQITNWISFFAKADFVPLAVLLSLVISLTFVGTFSYYQKNPEFLPESIKLKPLLWLKSLLFEKTNQPTALSRRSQKTILNISLVILILSSYLFVSSTFSYINKQSYFLTPFDLADLIQIISFMVLWIISTFILFVWISNEIEKSKLYKPDEFIPNLIRTFQIQGYVNIAITDDVQLQDGSHLIKARIQEKDYYFITQYDGRRIIRTLTKDEFDNFFNPISK